MVSVLVYEEPTTTTTTTTTTTSTTTTTTTTATTTTMATTTQDFYTTTTIPELRVRFPALRWGPTSESSGSTSTTGSTSSSRFTSSSATEPITEQEDPRLNEIKKDQFEPERPEPTDYPSN